MNPGFGPSVIINGREHFPDADGVLLPHPVGLLEMTNEQYHEAPGISKSHLTVIKESPFEYWRTYLDPEREPREETDDMRQGTAIHAAILEPHTFERDFIPTPPFNLRSNAGKQEFESFKAEYPNKVILKPKEREIALWCRDAVLRHPVAGPLFRGGRAEQTMFANDPETGALIKCRFDYLSDSAIDLKSVKVGGASPTQFARECANYDYFLQAPWYFRVARTLYGHTPASWVFVAVEKRRRPAIGVYPMLPSDIEDLAEAADRYFKQILACRAAGSWPDFGCSPSVLQRPGFYQP